MIKAYVDFKHRGEVSRIEAYGGTSPQARKALERGLAKMSQEKGLPDDWYIDHGGIQTMFFTFGECHLNDKFLTSKRSQENDERRMGY